MDAVKQKQKTKLKQTKKQTNKKPLAIFYWTPDVTVSPFLNLPPAPRSFAEEVV